MTKLHKREVEGAMENMMIQPLSAMLLGTITRNILVIGILHEMTFDDEIQHTGKAAWPTRCYNHFVLPNIAFIIMKYN